jgi:thiol:disulfide interchange protein
MRLLATLCSLLLGASVLFGCHPAATAPPVQLAEYQGADNEEALAAFTRQRATRPKQAILYFYADWCGPCRRFRQSLADDQVAHALQPAVLIKLNVDKYPALAAQYAVTAIPAFLKVDAAGQLTAHITSDKWQEDTPENIAPVMRELVSGHRYEAQ